MTKSSGYRADIDGIRAIAVVAVILFHLHMKGFEGGFVGVDAFFVISGFLITTLLLGDFEAKRFSLKDFYLRRIRRLSPALLTVLVPTTVLAAVILFPEKMRSFAGSLATQFVSLQNLWFLKEGEYFVGSDKKLLLHTWTLAVEEQFYLLWPLTLLVVRRCRRSLQLALLGIIVVFSFGINLALFRFSPKASFFLLPARAWELGAGGIVAVLRWNGAFRRLAVGVQAVLGIVGFTSLAWSIVRFTERTPFPGTAALLPVGGACLLIIAGESGATHPIGRLLSSRALVHIGLISYPAYLWHWPLIALANLLGRDPSRPGLAVLIVVTTFVLAECTYRYVETPIRTRKTLQTNAKLLAFVGSFALLLVLFAVSAWNGAVYRYPAAARPFLSAPFDAASERCGIVFRATRPNSEVCRMDRGTDTPGVLVWGNSHADMWSPLMLDMSESEHRPVFLNARNCRPTTDSAFCGEVIQRRILAFVKEHDIRDIVLASTWHGSYKIPDEIFEAQLTKVVSELVDDKQRRVWLVVDVPVSKEFDPIVAYRENPDHPSSAIMARSEFEPSHRRQLELFARLQAISSNIHVIDATSEFCDEVSCFSGLDSNVWYRDTDHLTAAGARRARRVFEPVFRLEQR